MGIIAELRREEAGVYTGTLQPDFMELDNWRTQAHRIFQVAFPSGTYALHANGSFTLTLSANQSEMTLEQIREAIAEIDRNPVIGVDFTSAGPFKVAVLFSRPVIDEDRLLAAEMEGVLHAHISDDPADGGLIMVLLAEADFLDEENVLGIMETLRLPALNN